MVAGPIQLRLPFVETTLARHPEASAFAQVASRFVDARLPQAGSVLAADGEVLPNALPVRCDTNAVLNVVGAPRGHEERWRHWGRRVGQQLAESRFGEAKDLVARLTGSAQESALWERGYRSALQVLPQDVERGVVTVLNRRRGLMFLKENPQAQDVMESLYQKENSIFGLAQRLRISRVDVVRALIVLSELGLVSAQTKDEKVVFALTPLGMDVLSGVTWRILSAEEQRMFAVEQHGMAVRNRQRSLRLMRGEDEMLAPLMKDVAAVLPRQFWLDVEKALSFYLERQGGANPFGLGALAALSDVANGYRLVHVGQSWVGAGVLAVEN